MNQHQKTAAFTSYENERNMAVISGTARYVGVGGSAVN
jgi:hypothetical protein